ncbi:MAG: penicillin-binding protein 1B [Aeromonas sp.]
MAPVMTVNSSHRAASSRWQLAVKLGSFFAVAGAIVAALFGLYLDGQVRARFDGEKWQLPVAVYGRALAFFPAQPLSQAQLIQELKLLNYQHVKQAVMAGEYSISGNQVELIRRPFAFSDGADEARGLRLTFNGNQLASVQVRGEFDGPNVARLEPMLLDRLNPQAQEDRLLVRLKEVPDALIVSLLTTEDRNFYQHDGVAPVAILRAALANALAGRTVQGGSTLTQQLAKNFFLTRERSLWRKVKEAYMALIIDFRYSKDEILAAYLNEIYLGQNGQNGIYGFGLAAYFYFGIPVNELEIHQSALLVGMVKGPSYYDPWRFPERAKTRRDLVLRMLRDNNTLSEADYSVALAQPLGLTERGQLNERQAPAFMALVKKELKSRFGEALLNQSGVKVFTTLDPLAQHSAEQAVRAGINEIEKTRGKKKLEAAMVVSDWRTGEVSAMVGGRNPQFVGFNRAVDARRQIGSLVKPAVYLTGLSSGLGLATVLDDRPLSLRGPDGKNWAPQNYDRQFRGQVALVDALASSLNVPTVNLGLKVGLENVVETLHRLGVSQEIVPYPSLVLGALTLSPLEVNQMYQVLANGGQYQALSVIRAVVDKDAQVVYRHQGQAAQVADSQASWLTLYAMTQTASRGTARALKGQFPQLILAGKTGTTNELRDAWFSGMDGQQVVSVWIGRDDNTPAGLTGSNGALPLFSRYMKAFGARSLAMTPPAGIRFAHFSQGSGDYVSANCANTLYLPARESRLGRARECFVEPAYVPPREEFIRQAAPTRPASRPAPRDKNLGESIGQWLGDLFN